VERSLTREDGATVAYYARGPEDGEPVLMLQGVGLPACGWKPQVDALADRFRCVTVDNRGIGGSTLAGRLSIEQMAADAIAVLDDLGWERAHLVGHSMGGLLCEELAFQAPERVKSLALLCTPASGRHGASMDGRMAWIGLRTRVGTRRMRRRAFLEMVLSSAERAERDLDAFAREVEPVFGRDLADSPSVTMKQVSAMSKHNRLMELKNLRPIPTLLVAGEEDPIAPPVQMRAIQVAMPWSKYVQLEGSHGVVITRADEVNALLAEHWA
jgi:pimeloyl-ACP methyl ester carboxylesterase